MGVILFEYLREDGFCEETEKLAIAWKVDKKRKKRENNIQIM